MKPFAVIVVAGGKSSRFGGTQRKTEILISGQPLWWWALKPFVDHSHVGQLILVVPADDVDGFCQRYAEWIAAARIEIVAGGAERFQSVENGLHAVRSELEWVAVHDAARPCVDRALVDAVFTAARQHQAAIAAIPVVATLKRSASGDFVASTVDRTGLWQAQTPQGFAKDLLLRAFCERRGIAATDESQLVEQLGQPVKMVPGSQWNVKVTHADDLRLAEIYRQFIAADEYQQEIPQK